MNSNDVKVGMRVRRTRDRAGTLQSRLLNSDKRGYVFTVSRTGNGWAYEADGTTHGVEVLEPCGSLIEMLAEAEAEVVRIKALIEAEKLPKAGEVWRCRFGRTSDLEVLHVDRGHAFGAYTSGAVGAISLSYLLTNNIRVDNSPTS